MTDSTNIDRAPDAPPVQLGAMTVPKASEVLADELRERILRGEFPQGTSLPGERELVAQTRLSRTTVREALLILEVQGLLNIRTGRAGGAFVQRLGHESVAKSIGLLIQGRRIQLAALVECRELIEPRCAQLAAKHRTDADLARLAEPDAVLLDSGTGTSSFLEANIDWHLAVAAAGHNELLTAFTTATSRAIFTSADVQVFADENVRRSTVRAHRAITEAIRRRDPAGAARLMRAHVHAYAEAIREVEERSA